MESRQKPEGEWPELVSLNAIGSRLKFRQLKLLMAVEDMGSVHRAAALLHLSQPGASKALREIEDTIGVPLFSRSTQGLTATDMGRCVIRHARLMHASLAHMHQELETISRGGGRRIAVGTIAGALAGVLAQALLEFRKTHPHVSVDLHEDTSAHLLERLQSGSIDMALCRTSVAPQPSLFEFEWLSDEKMGVAVSPVHPLAAKSEVTLQDAARYPWVLFPSHMPLRTLLEREMASQSIAISHGHVETASTFATALLLSKSHELVALFSKETIDFFERAAILKRLPIRFQSTAEPYGIVMRTGAPRSPSLLALCESLRQAKRHQAGEW